MTWLLLIHDNRARCIFAYYRLADYDGMPNLHVKIVAWCWHHFHHFKLRAWFNTLPNLEGEHGVLYYWNYCSWICYLTSFVKVFIAFLRLSADITFLGFFPCPHISCVYLLHKFVVILQFATVSRLELESRTGTWTHTFICRDCQVFTTAKLLINNVLY